jgi:predicted porin
MQKKLIAAAIASAFAAPVVASAADGAGSSTVQVFGTIYVEYSYAKQGRNVGAGVQPDRTSTDFQQTPGSEIGFKGEEPRGQSQNGFCSRNSALGLKGAFGNVFIGNWDTPFKRTISPNAVGGNDTGIWGTAFLLTGDSTTDAVGANRANFKKRQNNSINYDSPNFGGFQVMAMFSSAQTSTGTLDNQTNNKPRVWSLGLQYSAGPLYVSGGYEQHRQYSGAVGPDGSKDTGWHLGAAYTWGPVRVGGLYTRQKFDVPGGDVTAKAWHAGVDWTIAGPNRCREWSRLSPSSDAGYGYRSEAVSDPVCVHVLEAHGVQRRLRQTAQRRRCSLQPWRSQRRPCAW